MYWSTLDARKRCVYTCRILVCHPFVTESDLKGAIASEENRTIAHSPPPLAGNPQALSLEFHINVSYLHKRWFHI